MTESNMVGLIQIVCNVVVAAICYFLIVGWGNKS